MHYISGRRGLFFIYMPVPFRFQRGFVEKNDLDQPPISAKCRPDYHYTATRKGKKNTKPCRSTTFFIFIPQTLSLSPFHRIPFIKQRSSPCPTPFALHDPRLSGSTSPHIRNYVCIKEISTALTPPSPSRGGGLLRLRR